MGRKNKKWKAQKMTPLHLHKSFDGCSFNLFQSEQANYRAYRQIQFKKKMKRWYNQPFALFVEVVDDFKEEASNYSPNDEWYETYIFVPVVIFLFFCILLIYLVSIYAVIQFLIGLPIGIIAWKKRKRIRGLLHDYFSWEPVMIEVEINRNKQVLDRLEKTLLVKKYQFTSFDQQIGTHKNKKLEAKYGKEIIEKSKWYQDTVLWLEYCINGLKENNSELQIRKTLWEADYNLRTYHGKRGHTDFDLQHELFLERLEDIQRWRSLSEEVEYFDITEGLQLELKELERRRTDWERA